MAADTNDAACYGPRNERCPGAGVPVAASERIPSVTDPRVEVVARELWRMGNERIGIEKPGRAWEVVGEIYMTEAFNVVAALDEWRASPEVRDRRVQAAWDQFMESGAVIERGVLCMGDALDAADRAVSQL